MTFLERLKENLRDPSPIYDHANTTDHQTRVDNFSIVGREACSIIRTIKEAMNFRVNDPSLNRNIGNYQLSNIWDEVLFDTPALHLR